MSGAFASAAFADWPMASMCRGRSDVGDHRPVSLCSVWTGFECHLGDLLHVPNCTYGILRRYAAMPLGRWLRAKSACHWAKVGFMGRAWESSPQVYCGMRRCIEAEKDDTLFLWEKMQHNYGTSPFWHFLTVNHWRLKYIGHGCHFANSEMTRVFLVYQSVFKRYQHHFSRAVSSASDDEFKLSVDLVQCRFKIWLDWGEADGRAPDSVGEISMMEENS